MKNVIVVILVVALGLSWLYHWTVLSDGGVQVLNDAGMGGEDLIHVWVNELVGSPEEAFYFELEDLWNSTYPDVQIKLTIMGHSGYESKLRVALASGQPPDVCTGGYQALETLRYSGKAADLAVDIPEKFFPRSRLEAMGTNEQKLLLRDGHPILFPIFRYTYGGFIQADRKRMIDAGYDDEQLRAEGWTFAEFREACKQMTLDTDGDGTTDVWGFGAALVHLNHLFLNEFGPAVWGKEATRHQMLGWDEQAGKWAIHPDIREDHILAVFELFHQMLNVDKTWNPKLLSMDWNEINDEILVHRRLAMSFAETPWVAKLRKDIWEVENRKGGARTPEPPDLSVVWVPTLNKGDRSVPRAGVMGFTVMKQTPYKGDSHTENAIRVAQFLSHPAHLARSQFRKFKHLTPEPKRFGRMFPELLGAEDKWVQFYDEVFNSDYPVAESPLSANTPEIQQFQQLRLDFDRWLDREGMTLLQEVLFERMTPEEGAKKFYEELKRLPDGVEGEG